MPKFLLLENLMKKGINLSKRDYMISYLKNKFDFMGVMTPHRKLALKEFYKDYNPSNRIENNQFIDRLWNENEREYQHCALEIYFKYKKFWIADDIYFIENLVVNKSWWDTVDTLATKIFGEFFKIFPELLEENINRWINSNDMWLNRTAILCQLKYKKKTNLICLENSIVKHIHSEEFFHQKAIGWSLREYSKTDSRWVLAFVNKYKLKPLSEREALRIIKK